MSNLYSHSFVLVLTLLMSIALTPAVTTTDPVETLALPVPKRLDPSHV